MKKYLFLALVLVVAGLAIAAKPTFNFIAEEGNAPAAQGEMTTSNKALGRALMINGLYVFIKSQPETEFEVLGQEQITFAANNNTDAWIDKLTKKAREKYPNADALLYSVGLGSATVIKFKD